MSDSFEPMADEATIIGSRTLQRDTKEILDRVQDGDSIVILRHGRPAAALVPIDEEQARAIVLAGSPAVRALRSETGAVARAEPLAPQRASAEVVTSAIELDSLEETNRLLALAAERLAEHQRVREEREDDTELPLNASLLAMQQQSVSAALTDLLVGIRAQAEALGRAPSHEGVRAAGESGAARPAT
ncbi:MAG: type II toxin-antitoxin system Phd/YefM family antitoxin [Solirubrobacteraceae bacterium]